MEYTYFIVEHQNQTKEIKFTSPAPLRTGEQIEVRWAKYEITMIRYVCAGDRDATALKDKYQTIHMEAHVRELK